MKNLILTTAFLLFACPLLVGSTNPAAQQLLITAKQQASLFHDAESPLQLDVDFVAQMNTPAQGHLTLRWGAKDRWWRKIVMGDFEQIEIRNGDRLYTSRNISFEPVRIVELVSLLQFAEGSEGLLVKKEKQRVENGVESACLQVEQEKVRGKHEVCVNSASHEIVSDEWQEPPDQRRREQYTDYFDFVGHRYPRKLQLIVNGSKVITANVSNLATAARVVPRVAGARLLRVWPAIVNGTADWKPILGEVPGLPGFFMNFFPWMGFTAGPIAALITAALVLGRKPPIDISGFSAPPRG